MQATMQARNRQFHHPHHDASDLYDIEDPGPNDVLFGRGTGSNMHSGNIRFRALIQKYKTVYRDTPKKMKPSVSTKVVAIWRAQDPPGRFLTRSDRFHGSRRTFYDVGDAMARRKAAQCLREKSTKERLQQQQQQLESIKEGVAGEKRPLEQDDEDHHSTEDSSASTTPSEECAASASKAARISPVVEKDEDTTTAATGTTTTDLPDLFSASAAGDLLDNSSASNASNEFLSIVTALGVSTGTQAAEPDNGKILDEDFVSSTSSLLDATTTSSLLGATTTTTTIPTVVSKAASVASSSDVTRNAATTTPTPVAKDTSTLILKTLSLPGSSADDFDMMKLPDSLKAVASKYSSKDADSGWFGGGSSSKQENNSLSLMDVYAAESDESVDDRNVSDSPFLFASFDLGNTASDGGSSDGGGLMFPSLLGGTSEGAPSATSSLFGDDDDDRESAFPSFPSLAPTQPEKRENALQAIGDTMPTAEALTATGLFDF